MNQIFKFDGPVFTFLNKFCDVLILSTLWMVFSLPVITIGPASAALYHSVHKIIFNNEGYLFSTFWKSFRSCLKQGVLITLLCVPIAAFGIVSFFFASSLPKGNPLGVLYFAVTLLVALALTFILTYAFPILSRFYMTIPEILKTTIALAVTRLGFTLLLAVILAVCAAAFFIAPFTGFVLPACFAIAAERLLEPAFQKALDAKEQADSKATEESAEQNSLT